MKREIPMKKLEKRHNYDLQHLNKLDKSFTLGLGSVVIALVVGLSFF